MSERPILAVTLGDPAGIGAEVVAKTLAGAPADRVLLVGCPWAFEAGARAACVDVPFETYRDRADVDWDRPAAALLDVDVERPADFRFGAVSPACGRAAVASVERAAGLALGGDVDAVVTAPIHKEAVRAAGCTDIGHQEMLARLTGADWTATLLMTPGLRVAHLSTHASLIDAARYVRKDTIVAKLELLGRALEGWGLTAPRIAVAALNPHGGEGGLLGREEIEEIAPAVAACRGRGMDVTGPLPADSVFNRAIAGAFDVVLAMYHDQGHIAIKVHNFAESVTVTLGIPIIRTSVDHGTAFDIAGQGVADPASMAAALATARALVTGTLERAG